MRLSQPLPLAGVKVLDLSRVLAGPLCSMLLGDLGADVVKIERPGRGDDTRGWGPPFDERGESAYFLSVNRNKISATADLSMAPDRDFVVDLIAGADVVVENFRPGALEAFGISVDEILRNHSSLIWCTITGFGQASRRPGYDFVVQAESGWMAITGEPDGAPMKHGVALADVIAGKDAAIAILAALVARASSRDFAHRIVISLMESARAALINVAQNALVARREPARWGNAHPNLVPYQLFRAADRDIVIAVGTDEQWLACTRALELPHLTSDVALRTNAGRLAQRERIVSAFAAALARRSAPDWVRLLDAAGVPCGIVRSVSEVLADTDGASALMGMPSSVAGTMRLPPPRLDEHGDLVRAYGWAAFQRAAAHT